MGNDKCPVLKVLSRGLANAKIKTIKRMKKWVISP